MRVLVLGGTVFVGRHVVRAALDRGHHVTIFHRGRHPLAAPPGAVDERIGNRRGGLESLADGRWDAVVDLSGFFPGDVADSARLLAARIDRYVFVSSVSACAGFGPAGLTESAPVLELTDAERREGETLDRENPAQLERFGALYGALKVACEREVERAMPARGLVVRPGLIVGPHDPTDRFTYWPERIARGGEVLAPGRPGRPVQFVDACDLAEWTVRLVEDGGTGLFHATGPASTLTMGELLETCVEVAGSGARLTWCDEATLGAAGVTPWREMPLWIPEDDAAMAGFLRLDCRRAVAAGLAFRPLRDTVRDTLAWSATRTPDAPRRAGMTSEREREVLARATGAPARSGAAAAEPAG